MSNGNMEAAALVELAQDEKKFRQFLIVRITSMTNDIADTKKTVEELSNHGCKRYGDVHNGISGKAAAGMCALLLAIAEILRAVFLGKG
jgi:hypothetical protein